MWLGYITIENLDAKIRQFQKRPETLLLGSIFIIHKWSKDTNINDKDLKAKIYPMALKPILQYNYLDFSSKKMRC